MVKNHTTLLSVAESADNGEREWRFVVNGPTRGYYTVRAPNRGEADARLRQALNTSQHELGETASTVISVALIALAGAAAAKTLAWYLKKTRTQR